MAIYLVGTATGGAGTVTLPAHEAGDLILLAAAGTSTMSVPTGWTKIGASGQAILGYKFAESSSETSGNWTWGDAMSCAVYRGVSAIGLDAGNTSAATGTVNYAALTAMVTDGASWVVCGVAGNGFSTVTAPAGTTSRVTDNNGSGRIAALFDTNGGVASFSSANTDTASNYRSWTVELIDAQPAIDVPVIESVTTTTSAVSLNFTFNLPATVNAGDLLVAWVSTGAGSAISAGPTGWTDVTVSASQGWRGALYLKVASGSEAGGTATCGPLTQSAKWHATVLRISGWEGSIGGGTAFSDAYYSTANATRNPPSVSPSWGAKPTLWLAMDCFDNGSTTSYSAYPKGFALINLYNDPSPDSNATAQAVLKLFTKGMSSVDPGNFTTSVGQTGRAATLAIYGKGKGGSVLFWAFP